MNYEKVYNSSNELLYIRLNLQMKFASDTTINIQYKYEYDILKKNNEISLFYILDLGEDITIILDNGKEVAYDNYMRSDCRRHNYFKKPKEFVFKKDGVYSCGVILFDTEKIINSVKKYGEPNNKAQKVVYKLINKSNGKEVFRFYYDLGEINK